jgi:iron complex outermembrane receptor protein
MPAPFFPLRPTAIASLLALHALTAMAQTPAAEPAPSGALAPVTVEASADASAEGLTKPFAGGQVARGGRVGILGNQDMMSTPFSSTNYTNELIQDQQAKSVADVLLNDPSVRQARGFGNFQELYVVRGFPVYSDDVSYNGLYGMLPRQYIASEFFERVEVFRGANTFLNGAAPGGSGIGGAINLLPKRAPNEPLTRVGFGVQSGGQGFVNLDLARRFGPTTAWAFA